MKNIRDQETDERPIKKGFVHFIILHVNSPVFNKTPRFVYLVKMIKRLEIDLLT